MDYSQSLPDFVEAYVKAECPKSVSLLEDAGGKLLYARAYEILKRKAREGHTITYGNLAKEAAPQGRNPLVAWPHEVLALADMLGAISVYVHHQKLPLLGVLVVHQDRGDDAMPMPGNGFFELAKELGLFDGGDREVFFCKESERVFKDWKMYY